VITEPGSRAGTYSSSTPAMGPTMEAMRAGLASFSASRAWGGGSWGGFSGWGGQEQGEQEGW